MFSKRGRGGELETKKQKTPLHSYPMAMTRATMAMVGLASDGTISKTPLMKTPPSIDTSYYHADSCKSIYNNGKVWDDILFIYFLQFESSYANN